MARNNSIGKGDSKCVEGNSITNATVDSKKTLQTGVKSSSHMVLQHQVASGHRIIEPLRLEKTSKLIKSNPTTPAKPCPQVPHPHVF